MYHGRLYGQSGFCGLFHTEIGGAEEFLRHFRGNPGVHKIARASHRHLRGAKISRGFPKEPQNGLGGLYLILDILLCIVIYTRSTSYVY